MRMAVGPAKPRMSALACSVQAIRFTQVP